MKQESLKKSNLKEIFCTYCGDKTNWRKNKITLLDTSLEAFDSLRPLKKSLELWECTNQKHRNEENNT